MAETVAPRPASTILLLRDSAAAKEIEVFMMVRHYEIDFNSGALVFPGGSVDAGDKEIIERSDLYSGGEGLERSGPAVFASPRSARPLRRAASCWRGRRIRAPVDAKRASEIEAAHRAALNEGKITFLRMLADNGLLLALDTLVPYAHWITPEGMPKRFDTWFFLAAAPPDQLGAHDGRESDRLDLGVAARGAGGRRERPLQAAVPDHAQPDQARQAGKREAALEDARGKSVVTVMPVMTKTERRPPAPHSARGRL